MSGRDLDLSAMGAVTLSLAMLMVYLWIMSMESDQPVYWFVAALIVGTVGAGYGAPANSPYRLAALIVAGLVLMAAGLLAILSIGLPILVAGVLCLIAAVRHGVAVKPE